MAAVVARQQAKASVVYAEDLAPKYLKCCYDNSCCQTVTKNCSQTATKKR